MIMSVLKGKSLTVSQVISAEARLQSLRLE